MDHLRLIALDLDGTTLNSHGELSTATKTTLEEAIRQGINVVIASGRAKTALPKDILTIKGLNYAVTSNGSSIFSLQDDRRMVARDMAPSMVRAIVEIADQYDFPYEAFIEGVAYTPQAYFNHPTDFGVPERMNQYVQNTRIPVASMHDFVLEHANEIEGMDFVIVDQTEKEKVRQELMKIPDLYITGSETYYLELASGSVSKASSLHILVDELGISPEQVIAFGDGGNDIEMLTWAGCGVAMKNASPSLIAAADDITLSNDEDGVAYYLNKLLQENHHPHNQ